jgi:REP element-mobilizing transposase RayT
MPRPLRIEFEGAIYHVMNRGGRREPIFQDDADRQRFVETLGEACVKTGWQVHAYVLMRNHFHLVVETPRANLVTGMKWLLGTYSSRFNRRHKLLGHLFSGRYKSLVVDGAGQGDLKRVCDYVHLNPARARLVGAEAPLRSFGWSSWPAYLRAARQRPAWLRVVRLLGEYGTAKDSAAGRGQLERALEARRGGGRGAVQGRAARLVLGGGGLSEGIVGVNERAAGRRALRRGTRRDGASEGRTDLRGGVESAQVEGERVEERPKGDAAKVALAARLRTETTMTVGWIAERLGMGSRGYLNQLLYRHRKAREE